MPRLRAVSLFSGAGGLDLGIEAAGYDVVYAVEHDATAVETMNVNARAFFPSLPHVKPLDITTLDADLVMKQLGVDVGEIDLLVGGPPCVAFSKSGFHLEYKREGRDPRANLLWDYLRFLGALRPKAYMMENVFGLAYRNQSKPFFDGLRAGILDLGFLPVRGAQRCRLRGAPEPAAAVHHRLRRWDGPCSPDADPLG